MTKPIISKQQAENRLRGRSLPPYGSVFKLRDLLLRGQVIHALAFIRYYQPADWRDRPVEYAFEGVAQALEDGRIGDAWDICGYILAVMSPQQLKQESV